MVDPLEHQEVVQMDYNLVGNLALMMAEMLEFQVVEKMVAMREVKTVVVMVKLKAAKKVKMMVDLLV